MSIKTVNKYKNILKYGVFQEDGGAVTVSKDMFYKMVLKLYNYERFVESHPDLFSAEWEAQTIKEIEKNELGLNWWQERPENISNLLKR